jgi:effector-binding domain-containing protein
MKTGLLIIAVLMALPTAPSMAQRELQVTVKEVSPQTVLLLKGESSLETIAKDMGAMFEQLSNYMQERGVKPTGPALSLYYTEPGPDWEIAVAVPVSEDATGKDPVELTKLPGGNMLSTIHEGPYEKLGETWEAFSSWVKNSEHKLSGPTMEVYLECPPQESDPDKFQTELLWPIL